MDENWSDLPCDVIKLFVIPIKKKYKDFKLVLSSISHILSRIHLNEHYLYPGILQIIQNNDLGETGTRSLYNPNNWGDNFLRIFPREHFENIHCGTDWEYFQQNSLRISPTEQSENIPNGTVWEYSQCNSLRIFPTEHFVNISRKVIACGAIKEECSCWRRNDAPPEKLSSIYHIR